MFSFKLSLAGLVAIVATAFPVFAQQQADRFDAEKAKAVLTISPLKKPALTRSGLIPKGVDTVVKRSYNSRGVVIVERQSGATEEMPYVPIPILFVVNSTDLLDGVSRDNVRELAATLKSIHTGNQICYFQIEGHASAEGSDQHNLDLSVRRAERIRAMLADLGVDPAILASQGFGEEHARFPANASNAERQQDRRVLVVRER